MLSWLHHPVAKQDGGLSCQFMFWEKPELGTRQFLDVLPVLGLGKETGHGVVRLWCLRPGFGNGWMQHFVASTLNAMRFSSPYQPRPV
jgi:hypothetical protein